MSVLTFGCRLNAFESEVVRGHLESARASDTIVVNTCAVTAEAERQARQAIRKARREHPEARIVVTGCAAQIAPQKFAAMAEVDRVVGNREKLEPETWRNSPGLPSVTVGDIMRVRETAQHLIAGFSERTRAFVEIQQGCDHRCTFCIIPYGRGPNRSQPVGAVVEQVRRLAAAGTPEVVLTGVDITDYGRDLPGRPTLGQLCRRLLALVPELPRLRLSSVDPAELDEEIFALLAGEPRLMPHLHLSLQSGSDLILKRMKRRHLLADAERVVARARAARPDTVFGVDLIAGFPTETEEQAAESEAAVERLGLTYLHVFPYSPRPDTPAARMPQVAGPERRRRAARLRDLGGKQLGGFLGSRVGRAAQVLIERPGFGRTEHFAPVRLPESLGAPGEILSLTPHRAGPEALEVSA